jgi:hypothetical protein
MRIVWMVAAAAAAALAGCKKKATEADCEKIYWHAMELGARQDPEFDEASFQEVKRALEARLRGEDSADPELDAILDEGVELHRELMGPCRELEKKQVDCVLETRDPAEFDRCALVF